MKKTYVATSMNPPEQKHKPTSTEASSREDYQVWTVGHPQQDRPSFESINKFNALYLLDDDEVTAAHPQKNCCTFESISKFEAQRILDGDECDLLI